MNLMYRYRCARCGWFWITVDENITPVCPECCEENDIYEDTE